MPKFGCLLSDGGGQDNLGRMHTLTTAMYKVADFTRSFPGLVRELKVHLEKVGIVATFNLDDVGLLSCLISSRAFGLPMALCTTYLAVCPRNAVKELVLAAALTPLSEAFGSIASTFSTTF